MTLLADLLLQQRSAIDQVVSPLPHIQKKKQEMSLDSEAVFNERMVALGLQEHTEKFHKLGWKTYGSLAFATSFVPGRTEDERFLKDIVEAGLGDSDHHHKGALRRLFFESYTLAAADLKRKVEVTSTTSSDAGIMPSQASRIS